MSAPLDSELRAKYSVSALQLSGAGVPKLNACHAALFSSYFAAAGPRCASQEG